MAACGGVASTPLGLAACGTEPRCAHCQARLPVGNSEFREAGEQADLLAGTIVCLLGRRLASLLSAESKGKAHNRRLDPALCLSQGCRLPDALKRRPALLPTIAVGSLKFRKQPPSCLSW